MSRHRTVVLHLAALTASGILIGGCNNGAPAPSASSTTSSPTAAPTSVAAQSPYPTLTAPKLQPPSQDNEYTRSTGRPKVVFDPCTWVPDDLISQVGFDPTTRKRATDLVAEYTFLSCQFSNGDQTLQLSSGNVSMDEDRQRYAGKFTDLTIDGRNGFISSQEFANNQCDVDIPTKVGFFGVTVIVDTPGAVKGEKPCDHIVDIATTLEQAIGKDN